MVTDTARLPGRISGCLGRQSSCPKQQVLKLAPPQTFPGFCKRPPLYPAETNWPLEGQLCSFGALKAGFPLAQATPGHQKKQQRTTSQYSCRGSRPPADRREWKARGGISKASPQEEPSFSRKQVATRVALEIAGS